METWLNLINRHTGHAHEDRQNYINVFAACVQVNICNDPLISESESLQTSLVSVTRISVCSVYPPHVSPHQELMKVSDSPHIRDKGDTAPIHMIPTSSMEQYQDFVMVLLSSDWSIAGINSL